MKTSPEFLSLKNFRLNSVASFAGKLSQKAQAEERLKQVVARLKALEAEKQWQIKNGTWAHSFDDLPRTKKAGHPGTLRASLQGWKRVGEKLRNSQMTMD
ncbi:MAG TPA: hypothetical protein ENN66_01650 [Proteobacteria bacterium]|nr:hypothetical protein [Pseudomonadota bacterium]